MSYTLLENKKNLKTYEFKFPITVTKTQEFRQPAIEKAQKKAVIKGYRKGKAPLALVEKVYAPEIEQDALNRFIQKQVGELINAEGIEPLEVPTLTDFQVLENEQLNFKVNVEILPKVETLNFANIQYELETKPIQDQAIEDQIQQFLKSKSTEEEISEGVLKKDDTAVIDFTGRHPDGSYPDSMKGTEHSLEIGSNTFIPGFEDQLIGLACGDEKTIKVTFPSEYPSDKTLENQQVEFLVKLHKIKVRNVPALNDEHFKELGFADEVEMRASIRKNLTKEMREHEFSEALNTLLVKIADQNDLIPPTSIVNKSYKNSLKVEAQKYKQFLPNAEEFVEKYMGKQLEEKALSEAKKYLVSSNYAAQLRAEKFHWAHNEAEAQNVVKEFLTAVYRDVFEKSLVDEVYSDLTKTRYKGLTEECLEELRNYQLTTQLIQKLSKKS